MKRSAVKSRDLAIVGYDAATETLEVTFRGGGVYQYEKVPAGVYEELMRTRSHGIYFRDHIKDKFPFKKVH